MNETQPTAVTVSGLPIEEVPADDGLMTDGGHDAEPPPPPPTHTDVETLRVQIDQLKADRDAAMRALAEEADKRNRAEGARDVLISDRVNPQREAPPPEFDADVFENKETHAAQKRIVASILKGLSKKERAEILGFDLSALEAAGPALHSLAQNQQREAEIRDATRQNPEVAQYADQIRREMADAEARGERLSATTAFRLASAARREGERQHQSYESIKAKLDRQARIPVGGGAPTPTQSGAGSGSGTGTTQEKQRIGPKSRSGLSSQDIMDRILSGQYLWDENA